jgi:outer membrane protein insertion porin family
MYRFSAVATCTIALAVCDLSACDVSGERVEAAQIPPAAPPDVIVPVEAIAPTPGGIAPPETIVAQTAPTPAVTPTPSEPAKTVQYYQDYQSLPERNPVIPASTPTGAASTTPNRPSGEQNPSLPASSPLPATLTPIAQPAWMFPAVQGSATPASNAAAPRPLPPKAAPQPNQPASDLVVTATDVQIRGIEPELQEIIRSKIRTVPGGPTNNRQLQADVTAILETGLISTATVSSTVNANGLDVVFQVAPIVPRSIQLVGAQALTPQVVNDIFKSQLGVPVQPSALNQGVRSINQWYAQNGYSLARVLALQPSREGILTINVAEGVVSDIQIRFTNDFGNPVNDKGEPIRGRTQEGLIKREIQLKPGQVFRQDVVQQDLQRLLKTGIFSNAKATLEGDARQTIVVYNVSERTSRGLNAGGGYSDDLGVYGSVSYRDQNFAGLGQQLGTNILVGTKDVQFDGRFLSPYRESDPDTLGYGGNFFRRRGLSRVFDDEIKLANGQRVREGRFGGGISVNRPISQGWDGTLGLNFTRLSLRDGDGRLAQTDERGNPLSFSGKGIDDLYTIGFTAVRDQRDNPIDPKQGSFLSLSTEQSLPIGVGNLLSNKLQASYTQYIPVNALNSLATQKESEVVALNIQGGTTIGDLPPANAFTLGGVNSVRGYGTGEVGIGRSFLLASAEYRFPIYKIVGGALFADFASDLGSAKAVLGEPGVQRDRPGTGFGIGAGVRLKSPIGIIRGDFSINDQGYTRFQFGFGQKF